MPIVSTCRTVADLDDGRAQAMAKRFNVENVYNDADAHAGRRTSRTSSALPPAPTSACRSSSSASSTR